MLLNILQLQGFYIVTYALGIYNLNLLLGFLTPQIDPELEGPTLPSKSEDEFRPFVRRLPEFKFWYFVIKFPLHPILKSVFSAPPPESADCRHNVLYSCNG